MIKMFATFSRYRKTTNLPKNRVNVVFQTSPLALCLCSHSKICILGVVYYALKKATIQHSKDEYWRAWEETIDIKQTYNLRTVRPTLHKHNRLAWLSVHVYAERGRAWRQRACLIIHTRLHSPGTLNEAHDIKNSKKNQYTWSQMY